MITLTRTLARQLRTVFRKSVFVGVSKSLRPSIVLQADGTGLLVRVHGQDVAAQYRYAGEFAEETLALPAEALDACAGRGSTLVTVEATAPDAVQVRWEDGGVPQLRDYHPVAGADAPAFPTPPEQWTELEADFFRALAEVMQTAAQHGIRFALEKVLLRGGAGELVGTDGKQLLIHSGLTLPWPEDLLVPVVPAFGSRELPADTPVTIGRTATHVWTRLGEWSFALTIDMDGRFPKVENVLPQRDGKKTVWHLSEQDGRFLTRTLPRLPDGDDELAGITVDLDDGIVIRASAEGQGRTTEAVLRSAEVAGPPVRVCMSRKYLLRALQLGVGEMHVHGAERPVVFRDQRRTYVVMPLDKRYALPPSNDALRIECESVMPEQDQQSTCYLNPSDSEERTILMTKPATNADGNGDSVEKELVSHGSAPPSEKVVAGSVIEEAIGLRDALRDALGRASRLVVALQRQRKHTKLFASALTSLRELQHINQ